ncbi:hypothetical protein QWY85_05115, partial [Neolewinella lacunae]|nr:hypothetical protein [Neolewinella lacunae]
LPLPTNFQRNCRKVRLIGGQTTSKDSIGFDRTPTGNDALSQYPPAFAQRFADPKTCPPEFLLWFHRLPWEFTLANGNSLWRELGARYQTGVDQVKEMQTKWHDLEDYIDTERFQHVSQHSSIQHKEAEWWRNACLAYFSSVANKPIPAGIPTPPHPTPQFKVLSRSNISLCSRDQAAVVNVIDFRPETLGFVLPSDLLGREPSLSKLPDSRNCTKIF